MDFPNNTGVYINPREFAERTMNLLKQIGGFDKFNSICFDIRIVDTQKYTQVFILTFEKESKEYEFKIKLLNYESISILFKDLETKLFKEL